ncbi:MAG: aldose epimerase family protein [Alphaproteobacteria bacterium]
MNALGKPFLFDRLGDGASVEAVDIVAGALTARVITLGACVQSLTAPDREGRPADIVLGHENIAPYVEIPLYLGCTVGRYANRIAGGRFVLDGKTYELVKSDGPNTLHGGMKGFDKVLWRIESAAPDRVTLVYASPDGDQGFPGACEARVTYTLTSQNEMIVTCEATTDKPTIVNMTHHGYFNLAGATSGECILDHDLTIAADAFTPCNDVAIPTGELRAVAGTPFDFREPRRIGAHIDDADEQIEKGRGYDHNFVLCKGRTPQPEFAARLSEPRSGRVMDILTTEPGLQFYSGNFLDGRLIGKGGVRYPHRAALCLEPQLFPDTPNQPAFGSARLAPGETYRHVSIFKFSSR